MTVHTATQIVVACENSLGWCPSDRVPLWKARNVEAAKINRRCKADSVSLDDLGLAVELVRRKRSPITSPLSLFSYVEEARELANSVPVVSDLSADVQTAISWELTQPAPDKGWLGRLVRAQGQGRKVTLDDWRAAGRG